MARHIISAHGVDFASASLEAAKALTLNGVDYHDGDPIPDGILPARTARLLFEQRRIRVVIHTPDPEFAPEPAPEPVPAPLAPEAPPAATTTPEPAIEPASGPEIAPEAVDPATLLAAAGWSSVHEGFGRWYAVNGEAKHGPYKRAEIEHLLS